MIENDLGKESVRPHGFCWFGDTLANVLHISSVSPSEVQIVGQPTSVVRMVDGTTLTGVMSSVEEIASVIHDELAGD